jgi:PST family polysaccharide transporter
MSDETVLASVPKVDNRILHTDRPADVSSSVPEMSTAASLRTQLDRSLVRGIAWTGSVKWIAQALSWISVLVLARLLSPDDYGLVGMANVYIGLVAMINEFGIGAAVVAQRTLDGDHLPQIHGLAVVVGGLCSAVSCVAAIPVAAFYGVPQLRWVVIVMSTTFVIYSLKTVPQAVMSRELKFKLLAKIDGLQVTIQALSTVAFAMLGMRYWSLVLGTLVGSITGTTLVLMVKPSRLAFPRIKSIRQLFTFSQQVVVGRIAWYAQTNADFLTAGRLLGKTALGYYTFAWTLASLPIDKVTAFIHQVTFPLFSRVQSDQAALRRYLLKLTELLSLIAFPLACGMAAVAHEFVLVVLGQKWIAVVVPLQILALSAMMRAISPLLTQILLVVGESRFVMNLSVVNAIVLSGAFFCFGARWGTVGIASAWLLIHPFLILLVYRQTFRKIGMSTSEYLHSLWPALGATSFLIVILVLLRRLLPLDLTPGLLLGIEILIGAAAYSGPLLLFRRQRLTSFFQFLAEMRGATT